MRKLIEVVIVFILVLAAGFQCWLFFNLWQGQQVAFEEFNPSIVLAEFVMTCLILLLGIGYWLYILKIYTRRSPRW